MERVRERNIKYMVASCMPPTGDLACNPGMCPSLGLKPTTLWFAGRRSIH